MPLPTGTDTPRVYLVRRRTCLALLLAGSSLSTLALAAPDAVDDSLTTSANTAFSNEDLSSNDTAGTLADAYSISTPPSHGTASLTSDGLLDYTPDIGFSSIDTLTYTIDDGIGGSDTATVTIDVSESSDYVTTTNNSIITQENVSAALNLTVDPSLYLGGSLQDIIGVDALYRAENAGTTPAASTIPQHTIGISITGYATLNTDTALSDVYNDDYQVLAAHVDLRTGTYSGRLNYNVDLTNGPLDQFSWQEVPLNESVLSDPGRVSGFWSGATDPTLSLVSGQIQITETIPLHIAYHIEYMTADNDSADFQGSSGDVQTISDSDSAFSLPAALEPTGGARQGFIVLSGNSAANGSNFAEEHKGFSRLIIDLDAGLVSGVLASEAGETDDRVTSWAFSGYPLMDLRDTPSVSPVAITASATKVVGDTTAINGASENPTIYIDASGDLIVERDTTFANKYTTIYTSEYYERKEFGSIASFVSINSDTTLFDAHPEDGVDENNKPVNIQTFDVPATASIGLVQMSWNTLGGSDTNENMGIGFAVIDMDNATSSGSITFSRTSTPDLLAWQNVSFGTTMFGATDGSGTDLYQSNKLAGAFTDDYAETARFTLVNNADGSRTLEFTATSTAGNGTQAHVDYWGNSQISWLGSAPFTISGALNGGTFSHGSPLDATTWEVDYTDIPSLSFIPDNGVSGSAQVDIIFDITGETESIAIGIEPTADAPTLSVADTVGYVGNGVALDISVADSVDTDGSESQLQTLTLTDVPASITLSSSAGNVTDLGAGSWLVDAASLATLSATGTDAGTFTITTTGINTDQVDIDGDTFFEDGDNGSGFDEVDTLTVSDTFDIIIRDVPTVTTQNTNSNTPVISGAAVVAADEVLTVTVDGITYTAGDGNLVVNGNDTWDLTIPANAAISEGTHTVTATLTHSDGSVGDDISSTELFIDTTPPATPSVDALLTNDTSPVITGTANLAAGETLSVTVDGITYTPGDGNLVDNGSGNWTLSIPVINALSEGSYSIIATATDSVGNASSDNTSNELVVDITAPAIPTVSAQTTNDTTPEISGTATLAAGEILTVTVDGSTYTDGDGNLVDNGNDTWTLNVPAGNALAEGSYSVGVTVTDGAGNSSTDTTSSELLVDTTNPAEPAITAQTTNNTTPLITGTATLLAGETLTVAVDGIIYTAGDGNLVDNGDGSWTLSVPAANALTDGSYPTTVTVTDAAGNSSTDPSTNELVIDTAPPVEPTVNSQSTNDNTPDISGTATLAAGETLTVTVNSITYAAGDGNLVDNGDGTWTLSIPAANALNDTSYSVTATVIDTAGNSSLDTSTDELIIDTVPPATPTVITQNTNDNTPAISGTATVAPGETLSVTLDSISYTAGDGNLVDNGDGTWVLNTPTPLTDDSYDVTATLTDLAGNVSSDTTSNELLVDTVAPAVPTVISQITNDNTPDITGTATLATGEALSVTVDGITYTSGDGNLLDNGDGTWVLSIPAANALSDATYSVISTITDSAGNTSMDTSTDELLIDTIAPDFPAVTAQTTSDNTPAISGSATVAPGETLTVTVDSVSYTAGDGNLIDQGDGTWVLNIPTPLTDGSYDVTATLTDSGGNVSSDTTSDELIIDTTAPAAPTVMAQTSNNNAPLITGTATLAAGETLTVTVDGVTYTAGDGDLVDNGDGSWALSVPDANALTDGSYSTTVIVTDAAGNTSTNSSTNELVIDTTDPVEPTVNAQTTNDNTPEITGTATLTAGEILTVTVDGVTYTAGDGNLVDNGDDSWTLSIPVANTLIDATYPVTAMITDNAGNTSLDTTTDELIIDTAAPNTPTVTAQSSNNDMPAISGTATVALGETLTVTVDSTGYTAGDGNLIDNGDGTWVLNIPTALPDGSYEVIATLTDLGGNTSSDTSSDELLIDTIVPAVPTVTSQITNDNTPEISGTATLATGETLTVTVDSITYSAGDGNLVDNGDGSWVLSIPAVNTLNDATYSVTSLITDSAGNISSDTSTDELVIDTVAPALPTITTQITRDNTPAIVGTATLAADETLTLTIDGVSYTVTDGNLIDNNDGTWVLNIPTALADGSYDVTATITDPGGNTSPDTTNNELLIDTIAPAVPTVTSQITNDNTPEITGTAPITTGEILTVAVNSISYTAGDGNLVDNGDGSWTLSVPAVDTLNDDTYPVTALLTDSAGNTTLDITTDELVIDTAPPTAPTVTTETTRDNTPVITGTATLATGETLTVSVDGISYSAGDGNLADNGDGTWTLDIPAPLADDSYDVTATITDLSGNASSDNTSNELLIDTTAPAVPTVVSQTTNDSTPEITGTATLAAGETLTVTIDGVTYTAGDGNLVDNGDGTWALNIPSANALTQGSYPITVTLTDAGGNTSSDTSNELVIDTTVPEVPTVNSQSTNDNTPDITGTATLAAGETLTVTIDAVTYTAGDGNLIDNGDGTWLLNIPTPLADDSYDVTASITDFGGNVSSDTTSNELLIDTTSPVVPTVISQTSNDASPALSGTATIATNESLSILIDGITYTVGDGHLVDNLDGSWTLNIPEANSLSEGTYPVTATISDTAGNATSDNSNNELIIDTTTPAHPGINTLITNDSSPVISGTAVIAAGETLTVSIDDHTYTAGDGRLVDNADGTWVLSMPVALAEGGYDVAAVLTDTAGNTNSDTTLGELRIDYTAPMAPGVTSLTTADHSPVIVGTASINPGETLSVMVDGVTYVEGDGDLIHDNAADTWSLTIPTANALSDALYQVVATLSDEAGNSSTDVSADELLIDTAAPSTPGVTSLTTNDTAPVIRGTASLAPGEILTVDLNGANFSASYNAGDGNLVDNGDGSWALTVPVVLPEGSYDVIATVTDSANNSISDHSTHELLVDTTPPTTPTITPLTSNDTLPLISGTATIGTGETLSVTLDNVTYTVSDGSLVDNGDGSWQLNLTTPLTEGVYDVTATITDAAGNTVSDGSSDEIVIDTTSPAQPAATAQTSNSSTPVIQGTAATTSGDMLTVSLAGISYTTGDGHLVDNGDGTWTLTIPDANALGDGTYPVTVTLTDVAGNTSLAPTTNELHIDTAQPSVPDVTSLHTNSNTPVLSGTASLGSGETLSVAIDGISYIAGDGNLVSNDDGSWTLILPMPLAEGQYDIVASVTDLAGNTITDTTSNELTIDTTPPPGAVVTTDNGSDLPDFSGVSDADDGATVSIINAAGEPVCDTIVIDGQWSCTPAESLDTGSQQLVVTTTDASGDTVSTSFDITIANSDDSDGDGISDAVEGNGDSDGDGIIDSEDLDSDNDGIPDASEGSRDSDGDGLADYLDLDSDNDGIADIAEVQGEDNDNDYRVDGFVDRDNNGLSDDLQLAPFELVDTDHDRIPDFLDVDSDNDGITDLLESGGIDEIYDGRIDQFVDANNDGADDARQIVGPAGRDTDNDGIPNRLELDSDNDGISDATEAGAGDDANDPMLDTDQDGIPDSVDVDQTAGSDVDGDGIDDRFDASFLNDGDADGDGIIDSADPDADGDGLADDPQNAPALGEALPDINNNNVPDILENEDGVLRTGLNGRGGCSITGYGSSDGSRDPLFLMLIAGFAALWWRRRAARKVASFETASDCRKINMTPSVAIVSIVILSSIFGSSNALADSSGLRPWIGAGIGLSRLEPDTSEISQSVTNDDDTALRGMIGLDVNSRLAVELSYTDMGEAGLSQGNRVSYREISGDLLIYVLANKTRREHRVGLLPFGRIGVSSMTNNSSLPYQRENNTSIDFGAGLEYGFRNGLAARAEIISMDTDAHYAGLGLIWRLGKHRHEAPVAAAIAVAAALPVIEKSLPIPAAAKQDLLLDPILFDTESALLDATAQRQIALMADTLLAHPEYVAVLTGHADLRGSVSYNQWLSQQRVDAVIKALSQHGVDVLGYRTHAAGETDRFGSMNTINGRHQNRRVEITATKDQ